MVTTFTAFFLILWLYALARILLPLRRCRLCFGVAAGFMLLLLPGAFKFWVMKAFAYEGRYFAPELPSAVLLSLTWLNLVLLLLGCMLLLCELLKLPVWSSFRMWGCLNRAGWRRAAAWLHAALALAALAAASLGMHAAFALPQVRELTVELPGMPAGAQPIRLALMADLHADCLKKADFYRPIVEEVNALQPDAVVIAGDFADGDVPSHGANLAPLRDLRAPLGVFGVSGNHEYYSGGYAPWKKQLESYGVCMLDNEHRLLGQSGVVLAGVEDAQPNLQRALRDAPGGNPVVLLCHRPALAPEIAADGRVSLQLSGHTHGGMMRGFDAVVARYNKGYVAGAYQVGRMLLYVSRGTNLWSGMAVRLGVPSEITLITLCPPAKEGR